MKYKEQLQKVKDFGLDIISLEVANEVKGVFDMIELTEEDFEMCCSFIEKVYLKSEYSNIYNLTKALRDMIFKDIIEDKIYNNIKELIDHTTKWDLIEKANWY